MEESALFKLSNGVYVLGAMDGERPVGCIVDVVTQIALKPLTLALSSSKISYTRECIEKTKEFSVSVLSKKVDPFIIANFGFQSSRNVNKWEKADHFMDNGLPYLKDNIATLRAKVVQEVLFESHKLFIAEILDAKNGGEGEPLTYYDYRTYFKDEVFNAWKGAKK